jgi:hypothetical protein
MPIIITRGRGNPLESAVVEVSLVVAVVESLLMAVVKRLLVLLAAMEGLCCS